MSNIRSSSKILVLFFAFLFILASCDKEPAPPIEDDNLPNFILDNDVFFHFDYTNFGWDYYRSGWFIDDTGKIRGYEYPEDWKISDLERYIDKTDLLHNFNETDTILGVIEMDELMDKAALIQGTLNGELSEVDCPGADIGSFSFYCYYWDEDKEKFKQQFLSIEGDCIQENESENAKELTEFLKKYVD